MSNELTIIEKSVEIFRQGGQILTQNQQRSQKGVAMGQQILQEIKDKGMSPELDERAMKYLVNCAKALKEENENRSSITQVMDEIKKMFIACENDIDVKKEGTAPNAIQKERNEYARKLAEEQKRREIEAAQKAAYEREKIDFTEITEIQIQNNYWNHLYLVINKMKEIFANITIDAIDDAEKMITGWSPKNLSEALKPNSNNKRYQYLTSSDCSKISNEILATKIVELQSNFDAEIYLQKQELIDLIPSKREELIEEKKRKEQMLKEAEEAKQREVQRQKEIAEANEKEKILLEEKARIEREVEKAKLEALKAEQEKAEQEKRARLEEENRKALQAQEDARKAAELEASIKAEGAKTMTLFEQEASISIDVPAPEMRTGYEIEVTHQAGYVQLFQLWFENEGKNLTLDKIEKTSFGQIKTWAEKHALKSSNKIESKFIIYRDSYKAVNRKTKAS